MNFAVWLRIPRKNWFLKKKKRKSVSEQKQSTPKIAPSFGPFILFIFLYAVILQTYYLLKEKYWQGRAQGNFELWPVMLTGQTSYSYLLPAST